MKAAHGFEIFAHRNGEAPMTDKVIIDTDILIDAGRNVSEAIDCLQKIEDKALPAISVVTQMEYSVETFVSLCLCGQSAPRMW